MCEFWYYSCKHATKYACKLPKLDRMITRPKGRPKKDAFGSTPFKRLPTVPEDSEYVILCKSCAPSLDRFELTMNSSSQFIEDSELTNPQSLDRFTTTISLAV